MTGMKNNKRTSSNIAVISPCITCSVTPDISRVDSEKLYG